MKRRIKLTESELRNLILENVSKVLEDIDIDPKNKGKFTATQKRTGKSTEELCHSKNKKTRQRANFARMAKRGWKPLNEDMYADQWEKEIKIFFDGLENGNAIVDNGLVAVEWGHSENDPRFIYYREGEDCLTDDHFSAQHSRRLYWEEISEIRHLAKNLYGVDIYIPDDEYYDELDPDYTFENKRLRKIIKESIKNVLNEISPELKARAMVKANHDLQRLNRSKNDVETNFNGDAVHKDTQKRRRDRQLMAFKKGLEGDMRRKYGRDVKFGIDDYEDSWPGREETNINTRYSVDYNDDTFRHYVNTDAGERGSVFYPRQGQQVGHRDMKAAQYLTNMVDGMAGYDSELKGHKPFNSRLAYVNDRAKDVENINKYKQDKKDYEERKDANEREINRYNSLPWYKKPFKEKPTQFTGKEPKFPKIKTGSYFMPNEPEDMYKRAEELKGNHQATTDAYNNFLKKK